MKNVNAALQRMLRQHEPFPAIVMDRHWNVLLTNEAVPRFFNCFIDMSARRGPRNLLHLMFDPNGMRCVPSSKTGKRRVEPCLLASIGRRVGRVIDDETSGLIDDLMAYPDVHAEWRTPREADSLPIIPLEFTKNGLVLKYFSMVTTLGTPQAIATQEMRIECMFPADDETEIQHVRFVEENSRSAATTQH